MTEATIQHLVLKVPLYVRGDKMVSASLPASTWSVVGSNLDSGQSPGQRLEVPLSGMPFILPM